VVRPIDEGNELALAVRLLRPMPDGEPLGWSALLEGETGALESEAFGRVTADASLRLRNADHSRTLQLRARAGVTGSDPAAQHLFTLGGAGTLPGHDYRSFGGSRFALLHLEASHEVLRPWIRVRALGALGATGGLQDGSTRAWTAWGLQDTDGVAASAGAGVSLFWDIIRIDRVRGLGSGGHWVWQLSASPDFADIS
jgi:hypothetical protein